MDVHILCEKERETCDGKNLDLFFRYVYTMYIFGVLGPATKRGTLIVFNLGPFIIRCLQTKPQRQLGLDLNAIMCVTDILLFDLK